MSSSWSVMFYSATWTPLGPEWEIQENIVALEQFKIYSKPFHFIHRLSVGAEGPYSPYEIEWGMVHNLKTLRYAISPRWQLTVYTISAQIFKVSLGKPLVSTKKTSLIYDTNSSHYMKFPCWGNGIFAGWVGFARYDEIEFRFSLCGNGGRSIQALSRFVQLI